MQIRFDSCFSAASKQLALSTLPFRLRAMVAKEKQLDELISATCKKIFSFWSMILTIYLINYISVFQITNCKKT